MESRVFWVRTMPMWEPGRPFELAFARPRELWDETNSLFRADVLMDTNDTQFVLVFRQAYSDGEPPGYFLVFLGTDTQDHGEDAGSSAGTKTVKPWCHTQFVRTWDEDSLVLDQPVENKYRCLTHSEPGAGVMFKCYISLAVVSGQELYSADLHVRVCDESQVPVPIST